MKILRRGIWESQINIALLLASLVAFSGIAVQAQTGRTGQISRGPAAVRPSCGSFVDVFIATDTGDVSLCVLGSWGAFGGGGSVGVSALAGTSGQVSVSASTGAVTVSIPTNPTLPGIVKAGTAFLSPTSNPAGAGILRLAKTDAIDFRNNANSADKALGINASDLLTYDSKIVCAQASATGQVVFNAAGACSGDPLFTWDNTGKGLHVGPSYTLFAYPANTGVPNFNEFNYISTGTRSANSALGVTAQNCCGAALSGYNSANVATFQVRGGEFLGAWDGVTAPANAVGVFSTALSSGGSNITGDSTAEFGSTVAIWAEAEVSDTSHSDQVTGVQGTASAQGSGATAISLYSFRGRILTSGGGSATNAYGLRVQNGAASLTNSYGAYIDDLHATGTNTYAFYAADQGSNYALYTVGGKWHKDDSTASRCARFDSNKNLVADTGDCIKPDYIELVAFDFGATVTTGDGAYYFTVPASLNGKSLIGISAQVTTPGTTGDVTVQLARCSVVGTGAACSGTVVDTLSTPLTINSGQNKSSTASVLAVVNGANALLATDQILRLDVDGLPSTPPAGLTATLVVQ